LKSNNRLPEFFSLFLLFASADFGFKQLKNQTFSTSNYQQKNELTPPALVILEPAIDTKFKRIDKWMNMNK